MKPQLVVAPLIPPAVADRARATFEAHFAEGNVEAALGTVERVQAIGLFITSSVKLTAEVIARLPSCLKIAATCSVGFDHIDVAAAKARGLIVTNTPEVLTDCTADLAFMLLLNACRRAHEYEAIMRSGWRKSFGLGDMLGTRASGKTLGIVGFGRIGRAMAQRARGFGMRVLYHDTQRVPDELCHRAEHFSDLRAMLPHCQILSLHAPGGKANDRMMNAETFSLLPRGAIFVNAARGALVDEDALIAALTSGHLAGAGLDVYRSEPAFDVRLADLPNIFLTPHMGSATVETRNAMGFRALDNLEAVCAGRPAIDPLWN
jgi:lactate dehydrogenase-like 2-hydroxyacid dehydrogenase